MSSTTGLVSVSAVGNTRPGTCQEHGPFVSKNISSALGRYSWSGCPVCVELRDQQIRRRYEEETRLKQARELERRLEEAEIPYRFQGATLKSYKAECDSQRAIRRIVGDYVKTFEENLEAGRCLVFLGPPGLGKTLLGCAMLNELADAGRRVRYATARQIIRELRETWRPKSDKSEEEVLDSFVLRPSLLVIDEVGVGFGTPAEVVQLTEVVDGRYSQENPTLVISNCDRAGLTQVLGERAVDRLRERGGKTLIFTGTSYRATAQDER